MDLFSFNTGMEKKHIPLAARMRPRDLKDFLGQNEILGPGKLLRRIIESKATPSLLFYGPPGTGKTTLAMLIAKETGAEFVSLNATSTNTGEIKTIITAAEENRRLYNKKTLVFLDEIHRFNKSQQDVLLHGIEEGIIVLIGATTENPYYSINSPLLSRLNIFRFESLKPDEIFLLLKKALSDSHDGLGDFSVEIPDEDLNWLAASANGDARFALNVLEMSVLSTPPSETGKRIVTKETFAQCMQRKPYDRDQDEHYHAISAFIKSMRGSDPDATVYWLFRMLEAGEDPRFVARRMIIHAAEDVGLANPNALLVAVAAYQALEFVGMPEARIPLTEAALYIATSLKSNTVVETIDNVLQDVQNKPWYPVPMHLRNPDNPLDKQSGEGKGYLYPHLYPGNYVPQQYLPPELAQKKYYYPSSRGEEKKIAEYLASLRPFIPKDHKKEK